MMAAAVDSLRAVVICALSTNPWQTHKAVDRVNYDAPPLLGVLEGQQGPFCTFLWTEIAL